MLHNDENFSNEQLTIALKELINTLEKEILILKSKNKELKAKLIKKEVEKCQF